MQIRVIDPSGQMIWSRSQTCGVTALSYRKDGTLLRIIEALALATEQARSELNSPDDSTDVATSNSYSLDSMLNR